MYTHPTSPDFGRNPKHSNASLEGRPLPLTSGSIFGGHMQLEVCAFSKPCYAMFTRGSQGIDVLYLQPGYTFHM